MRTTIRRYVKGSVQNNLSEYNPEKTYKVEMITRKTDEQIIAEELVKAEREKKEKDLLEAQLKLPPSKRSEELMRKYNLSVVTDTSLIDNYNGTPGVATNYEIYYPEDAAVKELRPSNHLVAIEKVYDTSGDEFNFYFHVSINEATPGTFDYKIDGMSTYVDKEYKLLAKGEFDLYKALYFYKMKDKSYRNEIMKIFKKYGIVSNDAKVLFGKGAKVDLKIKGLGMMVTHQPLSVENPKIKEEEQKVKQEEEYLEILDQLVADLANNNESYIADGTGGDVDLPKVSNVEVLNGMEKMNKEIPIQVHSDGTIREYTDMHTAERNIILRDGYELEDEIIRVITSPQTYAIIDVRLLDSDDYDAMIYNNNLFADGERKGIQNTKAGRILSGLRKK